LPHLNGHFDLAFCFSFDFSFIELRFQAIAIRCVADLPEAEKGGSPLIA
jgi:hypothetical protein